MRKVFAVILGILLAPLIIYVGVYAVMWLLGYEFAEGPDVLAERLMAEQRPIKDCYRYVTLDPWFRPTTRELREQCVREYAKLTSDPTACELLLPSEYGLACISNLWPEVSGHVACGWNHTDPSIFECRGGDGVLRQSKNCQDFADNQKQFSVCRSYIAERAKESHLCAQVPDQSIRLFCETKMGAWEKYPELRGSFYFGQSAPQ